MHNIISDALVCEKEFICEALPVALIGMNNAWMAQYLEFCADRLLQLFRAPKLFNVKNPFEWMENIALIGKTNFFEGRNPDYRREGVGMKKTSKLSFNEEF